MPFPLLFIGIAAATGATGLGKTVKAGIDNKEAKRINEASMHKIDNANAKINKKRRQCGEALEAMGRAKVGVLNGSIKIFIENFEKIKNVDLEQTVGLDELSKFHIDKASFDEIKEMGGFASSLLGGAAAGVTGGALAAFGAYGLAQTFACASTGTAIASLSGAAATNATLAFFGGGALASGAGALGMAGGAYVLGGLVAGPALMVMGFITGAKAGKKLEEAKSNAAEAKVICEQLENGAIQCTAIRKRTYLFYNILARLDAKFLPLVIKLESIINEEGEDFSKYSLDSKKTVAAAASMAGTIKALLDTPLLTVEGELTEESKIISNDIIGVLKNDDE